MGFRLDGLDDLVLVHDDDHELDLTGDVTVSVWAQRQKFGFRSTIISKGAGIRGLKKSLMVPIRAGEGAF